MEINFLEDKTNNCLFHIVKPIIMGEHLEFGSLLIILCAACVCSYKILFLFFNKFTKWVLVIIFSET